MKLWPLRGRYSTSVRFILLALLCVGVSAFGVGPSGDRDEQEDQAVAVTVPKAVCGPNDHPETALQGQVPAALRASGFQGFNCNLQLVGQSRGDGANWQTTEFRDGRHVCAYHGTSFSTANRTSRRGRR